MERFTFLHQGRPGELIEEIEEGKVMAYLKHWEGVLPGKGTT